MRRNPCLPLASSSSLLKSLPPAPSLYGLLFSVMKWRTDVAGDEVANGGEGGDGGGGGSARGLWRRLEGEERRSIAGQRSVSFHDFADFSTRISGRV